MIPKNYLMLFTSLGYLAGAVQYLIQGRVLLGGAVLCWGIGNLLVSFV